jgi:hypothetical protein
VKSGAEQFGKRPTILFAQYSNPDFYPTTCNLARMLAGERYKIVICCRADRPANIEDYGEYVSVRRISKPRSGLVAPVEFAIFLLVCLFTTLRRRPSLLIAYDLLGRLKRVAMEYDDQIVPGTLELLRRVLSLTHKITVRPSKMQGCGILLARRRDLKK